MSKVEDASVKKDVEDKASIFDCLDGDVEVDLTADDMDDEIENYQSEPVRVRIPLQWWMSNENSYCTALLFFQFCHKNT